MGEANLHPAAAWIFRNAGLLVDLFQRGDKTFVIKNSQYDKEWEADLQSILLEEPEVKNILATEDGLKVYLE